MRTGHREPDQVDASPSGPQGLDFIPYGGNVHFNRFVLGLPFALNFKGRSGRAGFCYFTVFQALSLIVLKIVSSKLPYLTVLVTLVPTLCIWFGPSRETGRSGRWPQACLVWVVGLAPIYFAAQAGKPADNAWSTAAMAEY